MIQRYWLAPLIFFFTTTSFGKSFTWYYSQDKVSILKVTWESQEQTMELFRLDKSGQASVYDEPIKFQKSEGLELSYFSDLGEGEGYVLERHPADRALYNEMVCPKEVEVSAVLIWLRSPEVRVYCLSAFQRHKRKFYPFY